jgi:hypothetical protein
MSPKELLRMLIAARWAIIDQHEEIEGDAFSVTGTMIHARNGKRYNFDFHSMPEGGHYVLDIIEKN